MFTKFKITGLLSCLGLLISSFFFTGVPAQAQGAITLYPGGRALITIYYENKGDVADTESFLEVFVGDKLTVDPSSLQDAFGNGSARTVTSSAVSTSGPELGPWGTRIAYRPNSATATSQGQITRGPTNIPPALANPTPPEFLGKFSFIVTLRPDVTDAPGTVLRTISNQGILASFALGNSPDTFTSLSVTVADLPDCENGQVRNAENVCVDPDPAATGLARPNPDATTGGDFDGSAPQPIFNEILFNPNPGVINQPMVITTTGLVDSGTGNPLTGVSCETEMRGESGYQEIFAGTVTSGNCVANVPANRTPTIVGTYRAVTRVQGPNGTLATPPASVNFVLPPTTTQELPRTGGIAIIFGVAAVSGLAGFAAYRATRSKKIKVN